MAAAERRAEMARRQAKVAEEQRRLQEEHVAERREQEQARRAQRKWRAVAFFGGGFLLLYSAMALVLFLRSNSAGGMFALRAMWVMLRHDAGGYFALSALVVGINVLGVVAHSGAVSAKLGVALVLNLVNAVSMLMVYGLCGLYVRQNARILNVPVDDDDWTPMAEWEESAPARPQEPRSPPMQRPASVDLNQDGISEPQRSVSSPSLRTASVAMGASVMAAGADSHALAQHHLNETISMPTPRPRREAIELDVEASEHYTAPALSEPASLPRVPTSPPIRVTTKPLAPVPTLGQGAQVTEGHKTFQVFMCRFTGRDGGGFAVQASDGRALALQSGQVMSLATVRVGPRAVQMTDVVMSWPPPVLYVLRFTADKMGLETLYPQDGLALADVYAAWVKEMVEQLGAHAWPSRDELEGGQFPSFPDVAAFETAFYLGLSRG
jgi:hypothetical protein